MKTKGWGVDAPRNHGSSGVTRMTKGMTRTGLTGAANQRFNPFPFVEAFTLIELIVVIAIIAILASLLLPVLGRAKGKGLDIACRSNLTQLQLCWQMYVDDHDDALPPTRNVGTGIDWQSIEPSWAVGDAIHDTTPTNLQRGVLFPYNRSVGIYRCPADKATVTVPLTQPKILRTRTYQLDFGLNFEYNGFTKPRGWNKLKFAELVTPPPIGVLTFIDSHPATGGSAAFGVGFKEVPGDSDAWATFPGEQHGRAADLAFADGHVDHWRWRWSRKANSTGNTLVPPVNTPDRIDLERVQNAIPKP